MHLAICPLNVSLALSFYCALAPASMREASLDPVFSTDDVDALVASHEAAGRLLPPWPRARAIAAAEAAALFYQVRHRFAPAPGELTARPPQSRFASSTSRCAHDACTLQADVVLATKKRRRAHQLSYIRPQFLGNYYSYETDTQK
ncbi:hypothetical protein BC834DRAFT_600538 [Gloeopeniophorella convolvens]|nr:hypothetical protein BC834DRAFT_600538 [Gloeopeniophorella convolvens]